MIKIADKKIKIDSDIQECIFSPINYQDYLLGFIVAFFDLKSELGEEIIKLLKMFSTQIAPIIHSTKSKMKEKIISDTYFSQIIKNKLEEINSLPKPLSFAILRVIMSDKAINIKDGISRLKGFIKKTINSKYELVWQTIDTALLISPGVDIYTVITILKLNNSYSLL